MDPVLLGWPPDGPTLRLDYRRFSYAGKFVVSNTGKAVFRDPEAVDDDSGRNGEWDDERRAEGPDKWDDDVLAAVAFNEDRTDPETLWLRYVTVREDCRGEGLGPRLCAFVADRAAERGYDRLRIAVNNPFAYEALYRAGFAFVGEETGIAELILERPAATVPRERSTSTYRDGLERYAERELSEVETTFIDRRLNGDPPEPVATE